MKTQEVKAKTSRKVHRPGHGYLMTEVEIARQLGETPITVRNWRYAEIIPFVDCGFRSKRYRLADVLEALDRRTIRPRGGQVSKVRE
jgi:hypothetical protein